MAAVERAQLGAGDEQPHRPELVGQLGMGTGGGGLSFERSDLTLDLPHQVAEAFEVLLGGGQPTFRALPPAAELEDAGGFLDHRPPILGPGIEDGVELALTHDDVLLAPDPGVGQQLLDVEQAAGCPVDGVLAVPGPEQGTGNGDLGQVRGQLARAVVDGEGHLRPTQGGAVGGAHEDDVLHLRRPHGAGTLGAEHPGHRIDHVRLPTAIGPDDHGDPGLELEHCGIGKGLETLEGERLQEHRVLTLPIGRARATIPVSDLAVFAQIGRPTTGFHFGDGGPATATGLALAVVGLVLTLIITDFPEQVSVLLVGQ